MELMLIEVRTIRNALVCAVTRYLASLDLIFAEYPPSQGYVITIRKAEQ